MLLARAKLTPVVGSDSLMNAEIMLVACLDMISICLFFLNSDSGGYSDERVLEFVLQGLPSLTVYGKSSTHSSVKLLISSLYCISSSG